MRAGLIGITKDQTLRVSMVNLAKSPLAVRAGLSQNPTVVEKAFTLAPGESAHLDLDAAHHHPAFDSHGRVELHAQVTVTPPESESLVRATVQVFDTVAGKTLLVLPLT